MRITVIGGTGFAGANIVAEAARRGHEVTAWSRHEPAAPVAGVIYRTGSMLDDATLATAVEGAEVIIEALSPRGELTGRLGPVVTRLARLAEDAGSRFGVIGGAGSLLVAEGGPTLAATPGFPAEFSAEAAEVGAILAELRAWKGALDWFFVSPGAGFGGHNPGERTGAYRVGDDVLLTDENGDSFISGPDLGVAVVDEIDHPAHSRRRFTVAY